MITKKLLKDAYHNITGKITGFIKQRLTKELSIQYILALFSIAVTGIIIDYILNGRITWAFPRWGLLSAIIMYYLKWLWTPFQCKNIYEIRNFEQELNKVDRPPRKDGLETRD